MNTRKFALLLAALAFAASLAGCGKEGAVYVQSVKSLTGYGAIAPTDRFAGIVISEDVTKIEKDADKTVAELFVKEGDDVKEGQKLFCYDTEELQLNLDKQRLEAEQLQTSIESFQLQIDALEKSLGSVSGSTKLQYTIEIQSTQVDLKEAQLKLKTKEAEVKKSEKLLENAEVTSPVAGRIQSVNTDGQTDRNGNPLPFIAIQKSGAFRIKGTLGELQSSAIRSGDRLTILSRTDGRTWSGTVTLVDYENPTQGSDSDQYYIKTSEYFRDYTFVLPTSRKKVHFVLKDASTEQNNNRAANNMERRFALFVPENDEPIVETTAEGELNIYFTYELMPKATKQDGLKEAAFEAIKSMVPEGYEELLTVKAPTAKAPNRTLLEKHLTDYTAKNTFDYFIHKDLGGFLRRELDFYIKNEVLHIDDLDAQLINSQLTIVRAIKQVGEKIIRMLAQLENFQKKLWLKKKFVVQSDYCITLDRVPEKLYSEIIANEAQRKEWVRLFAIDEIKGDLTTEGYSEPLTIEFLTQNPFLVLDTAFFDAKFKHQLVKSMENIDEQTNGLLINSENFQALELLQEKFANRVKNIYADPPYNTSASEIMYKNSYKNSSWLSLMADRLQLGRNLLSSDGIQCTTIDDVEQSKLNILLEEIFEEQPETIAIRIKPSGRPIPNGFAISHEYGLFSKKDEKTAIARLARSDEQMARYRERDEKGPFFWEMLRKAGSNSNRENRPTMYYPFYWNKVTNGFRLPKMDYNEGNKAYDIKEEPTALETVIYPVKDDGSDGRWYFGVDNIRDHIGYLKADVQNNGITYVYYRRRPNEGVQPCKILCNRAWH